MAAQPKYITQPEFDKALTAFSGYVDHSINMAKAELRQEIASSEGRIIAKITALTTSPDQETDPNAAPAKLVTKADLDAAINGIDIRLNSMDARFNSMDSRLSNVETRLTNVETELQEVRAENQQIRTEMNEMNQRLDRVENTGKANHQMLQVALEQFSKINEQLSKINKRLGID